MQSFVDVYAQARRAGITPLEVDEMEPWQVAAALGVGATPTVDAPVAGNQIGGRAVTRGDGTPITAVSPGEATPQDQAMSQAAQVARNVARVQQSDQEATRRAFAAAQARTAALVRSPRGDQR